MLFLIVVLLFEVFLILVKVKSLGMYLIGY